MKGLTLLLDKKSVELLTEHTRLTNEKNQVDEDIRNIDGLVNKNKFKQLNLPVNYTDQINQLVEKINSNNSEQEQVVREIHEANHKIASLRQKSKTFSIALIVAVVVIAIVIATL